VQLLDHLALLGRKRRFDPVQEQGRLVEQTLGGADVFHDDRVGVFTELRLVATAEVLAGVDDDR
jgi:hypothetical protein